MDSSSKRLDLAIARFQELRKSYGRMPSRHRRTEETTRLFHAAQVEMYYLAQVICGLANPMAQHQLDTVRREIMAQIDLNIKVPTGARVITKQIHARNLTWHEFQLTPELSFDPTITNNAILYSVLRRLKSALRAQYTTVVTTTGRLPNF